MSKQNFNERFMLSHTILDQIYIDGESLKRYLELLKVLVMRNLKVRYRGSFLGVYWSLLNPLIMTAVYTAIFGTTFAEYYDNSTLNYVLAAFTGLVVTNFYSASTSQALASIVGNGSLLNKIKLPLSVFPTSMIAANSFQFLVSTFPLLSIISLLTSHNILNMLGLLLITLDLGLVCMGIGFFVSTLYIYFRDLPYFYEIVCFMVWISSPVFYPAAIVPDNIKTILLLNPLTSIIEALRELSLSGSFPNTLTLGKAFLSGFLAMSLGWFFFQSQKDNMMDLV